MSAWSVGVDIGGTRLRVLASHPEAGRRGPWRIAVPRSTDEIVAAIERGIAEVTGLAPGQPGALDQIAVGLPGHVRNDGCVWIPNLRFLDGVPLAAQVTARLAAPCTLVNDGHATLVAEQHEGAASGLRNVVLVTLGTGIGGAIMADGRMLSGANGTAGAFGWLSMPGGAANTNNGPFEQVASGTALAEMAQPWGGVGELLAAARSYEVADGDGAEGQAAGGTPSAADARAVIDEFATRLGIGFAALASILDPDAIVLAGGLSDYCDLLAGPLREAMAAYGSPTGRHVPVLPAKLGSNAGSIGALLTAMTPKGDSQ